MTDRRQNSGTPIGTSFVLGLAAWFALLTGLLEGLNLLVRTRLLKQTFLLLGEHSFWMAPLANLVWFLAAAAILLLLARRFKRFGTLTAAVTVFSLVSAFALLQLFRLHWLAALLLAGGYAVQLGRLVGRRPDLLINLVRRTGRWLALAVLVLAIGLIGSNYVAERRALASIPAARKGAPNILLLVLDTVRAMNLSLYGYSRVTTPHLQAWAARGVRFERALSAAPWTLPSHSTMFTGRWPHEQSSTWRVALDGHWPTLAETLRDRGYVTGGFAGNLQYCSRYHGLDRGFVHYEDFPVTVTEAMLSTSLGRALTNSVWLRHAIGYEDVVGRVRAADLDERFLRWTQDRKDHPFFGFINYYDAHQPFMPSEEFERPFAAPLPRKNDVKSYALHEIQRWSQGDWTPGQIRREMDAYDASIAELDADIDRLLGELDRRGALANTIVVITSDHGEQFGEHGLTSHGNSLYSQVLHVPLVILAPTVQAGTVVREPVTLRDLPVTILDLAGAGPASIPGASLLRHPDRGDMEQAVGILAEVVRPDGKAMTSVAAGEYHLIRNPDGSEEFFRLGTDPMEEHDARSEAKPEMVARLRAALDSLPEQPRFRP